MLLVEDSRLGGLPLALKAVISKDSDASVAAEFRTLARLAFPGLARVRDFGSLERGGGWYFTSDYVDGATLLDWAGGVEKDLDDALLDAAEQALAVLAYLHGRGVEHGDVKPQNVLVSETTGSPREVFLVDFGSARGALADEVTINSRTTAYSRDDESESACGAADLFGLGMALFHARVGHLPFTLGDERSRGDWLRRRESAEVAKEVPEVSEVLDRLVARLTAPPGGRGFEDARSAREWLTRSSSIDSRGGRRRRHGVAFRTSPVFGREEKLERVVDRISRRLAVDAPEQEPRLLEIRGASVFGNTSFLEIVRGEMQVRGVRTLLLASPSDASALEELFGGMGSDPVDSVDRVSKLLSDLESPIVLFVDGGLENDWHPALREMARALVVERITAPIFLLVSDLRRFDDSDAIGCSRSYPQEDLGPVRREEVERWICDRFCIESAPPALVEDLTRRFGGPRGQFESVSDAVDRLDLRVDFLGELEVPEDFEQVLDELLLSAAPESEGALDLSLLEQRVGTALQLGGEALDVDELSEIFPGLPSRDRDHALESLRWRGFVSREEAAPNWRFRWRDTVGWNPYPPELRRLSELTLPSVREILALARRSSRQPGRSPEWFAAFTRRAQSAGRNDVACRLALEARRLWVSSGRFAEAIELLLDVLRSNASIEGDRARVICALRAVDLALSLGRGADARLAMSSVAGPDPVSPAWEERRASILEHSGDLEAAFEALSGLLELLEASGSPAKRVHLSARAARIAFSLGRSEVGSELLATANEFAATIDERTSSTVEVNALDRLAACEIDHGDTQRAITQLELALAIAQRSPRVDEILRAPLHRLAVCFANSGRKDDAERRFAELEELSARRGDPISELKALYNRALFALRDQDYETAERRFRRAVRLSLSMGRHPFAATVWMGLAGVFREVGKPREALRLYLRVLRDGSPARPRDRVLARNNRADLYQEIGFLARSRDERERATAEARELGSAFLLGVTTRNLGSIEAALGRREKALAAFDESLAVASRGGLTSSDSARWVGATKFWLAVGRARSGNATRDEARRAFFEARRDCRRAGDTTYAEGCEIHIARELDRDGRRETARAIVERNTRDRGEVSRWLPMWEALACLVADSVEERFEETAAALTRFEQEGRVWPTFVAWTLLGEASDLPAGSRERVIAARERMASTMSERLPSSLHVAFRKTWFPRDDQRAPRLSNASASSPAPEGCDVERRVTGDWRRPLLEWVRERDEPLSAALERSLEIVTRSLGASGAGIVDPDSSPPLTLAAGVGDDASFADDLAGLLHDAREPGEARVGHAGAVVRLSDGDRFVWIRSPGVGWAAEELTAIEAAILEVVDVLDLVFSTVQAVARSDSAAAAAHAARAETRRLQAIVGSDDRLPDTAVITRRKDLREAVEGVDASLESGGAPVAASRSMREIMSRLPRLASAELPILILGESGVGKDCLARWIHFLSPRREAPFEAEVCSLPDSLLESELFGYVEGAFTGAETERAGVFERVAGGTLYLDEVTDLSDALQARLLRTLESRRVRRLGSETEIELDFRLISSSRVATEEALGERGVREELLWRLRGEVIWIPPLREREEDIVELTRHFVASFAARGPVPEPYVHPAALEKLVAHDWPGNVRELFNELDSALVENSRELRSENVLARPNAPRRGDGGAIEIGKTFRGARDEFERDFVVRTLLHYAGNASRAAEALDITRRYLGKLLEKHGIDLQEIKTELGAKDAAKRAR